MELPQVADNRQRRTRLIQSRGSELLKDNKHLAQLQDQQQDLLDQRLEEACGGLVALAVHLLTSQLPHQFLRHNQVADEREQIVGEVLHLQDVVIVELTGQVTVDGLVADFVGRQV